MWKTMEEFPENTPVLVHGVSSYYPNKPMTMTAIFKWGDWHWLEGSDREDDSRISFDPTHWMELPDDPS